ncbi:MAG: hypothetical protein GXP19_03085 [Gammaproteobacteria bacterium]|nr:hypothetical protein [Gammaproteobacteria bacterium]
MLEEKIKKLALNSQGMEIPKPEAKMPFRIKGIGRRRKEDALTYTIPSHSPKSENYVKGVTFSEFESAYAELKRSGVLTREWFNLELQGCAKEGSCNFTTIGGVFELLGLAKYSERGTYVDTEKA